MLTHLYQHRVSLLTCMSLLQVPVTKPSGLVHALKSFITSKERPR